MRLTFHGGAGSVTGANYLLESGEAKILVDCGLHQGGHISEADNYEPFAYNPKEVDALFITHAHIDHIGRVPKLFKEGFRGTIFSTGPTKEFAEQLLRDSQDILSREAKEAGRKPLYSGKDIDESMAVWQTVKYHEKVVVKDFEVELYDAGHILGSAAVAVNTEGKRIVFSGDLGNSPAPLIKDPEPITGADYTLIESVYGGRVHEDLQERKAILEDVIEDTVKKGGVLMIPAFAMERTQEILYELNSLVENGRIPEVPIFLDSPLAIRLTAIYKKYSGDPDYFDKESRALVSSGDAIFHFPGLKSVLKHDQSLLIKDEPSPKIIIAGSGMSNGGRIVRHEAEYMSDPRNTLLIVGYQVAGSLGRRLLDGEKEVRIMGRKVKVKAKVRAIGGYSSHADQPALLAWLEPMRDSLQKVFVTQGEEDQSNVLAQAIKDKLALDAVVPDAGSTVEL